MNEKAKSNGILCNDFFFLFQVALIILVAGTCYFFARMYWGYMIKSRKYLLEPPINIFGQSKDAPQKKTE